MQSEKYLHSAIKLLKRKDFLEAIHNLEEYIIENPDNYLGHYYMGLAYIFRELYDEAYEHINKANSLTENDANTTNALAFLNLKYNNVDEAINYWLDILDFDKKNYLARRNLDKVKKAKNVDRLIKNASPLEFINFKVRTPLNFKLPKIPGINSKVLKISSITIISIGIIALLFIYLPKTKFLTQRKTKQLNVKKLEALNLPDIEKDYIIDKDIKKSVYNVKPEEIKKLFTATKVFIKNKEYNKATVNINKVLHSNAGILIKERFKILKSFIVTRETFQLKDNIEFSTLMNLPLIYEDTQVVWEGKIEDIDIDKKAQLSRFNLFVKEDNDSIGIARIVFNKLFTSLTNGKNIRISGTFIKIDEKNRYPLIEGVGLQKIH
jgi:tetratricopeptide (TPR) repeat protein